MQMKINGVEFEFDIHDIDQSEAFENALEQLGKSEDTIKAASAGNKMSEVNRAFIAMFKDFFVTATGVDVIGNCRNSVAASEAYYAFIEAIGAEKGKLTAKYSGNRVR